LTFQVKMRTSSPCSSVIGRDGRDGARMVVDARVGDWEGKVEDVAGGEDVAGTDATPIPGVGDRRRRLDGGGLMIAIVVDGEDGSAELTWAHGFSRAPPNNAKAS